MPSIQSVDLVSEIPWGLFALLGLGLVVGWVMLVAYTAWVLLHPSRRTYGFAVAKGLPGDPSELVTSDPPVRGLVFKSWTFRSRGRELPVWDVNGLDAGGPVVVMTHGWGDSRVMMLPRLAAIAPMASRVVMWDMPGHGDAPAGFTLSAGEGSDLIALIEALNPGSGTGVLPLVLFGSSLGAGLSIVAAADLGARSGAGVHVALVIAEAPYRIPPVPARNVLRVRGLPFRTNLRPAMGLIGLAVGRGLSWALSPTAGGFDRALHAARLPASMRLLVLHGSLDPVCPVEDGRAISTAAPNAMAVVVEGAGHNNLWTDAAYTRVCVDAVRSAFRELTPTAANNRA